MAKPNALDSIRDLIRNGSLPAARVRIRAFAKKKIQRETRLQLAYLAGQAEIPEFALRFLRPIVRPKKPGAYIATDEERAEYAHKLGQISASREAIEILKTIDHRKLPRAIPFLAFAYFRIWEWKIQIPLLEQLLKRSDVNVHENLRTRLELATCMMYGERDLPRSEKLLAGVMRETRPDHYPDLHANCLQLTIQNMIHQRRWKEAREVTELADRSIPKDETSIYWRTLFEQWRAILELHLAGHPPGGMRKIHEIAKKFETLGRWENSRRCIFFGAAAMRSEKELIQLYFGSPFQGCRDKVLEALKIEEKDLPEYYDLNIGAKGGKPKHWIDVFNGANSINDSLLKAGQIQQRLLQALASDFYTPCNMLSLHEAIYPEDYFNPVSTPIKLQQAMKRLRAWLQDNRIPLQIQEKRGRYEFTSETGISLRIRRAIARPSEKPIRSEESRMIDFKNRLAERFGSEHFQSSDVQRCLEVSDWTARDLLKNALQDGILEKSGSGPKTSYRLRAK